MLAFVIPEWLRPVDRVVLWCLAPLAVAILISGLDDLVVDLAWAAAWVRSKLRPAASPFPPGTRQLETAPREPIAILVPLWKEHEVIARMLEHNVASIRYPDYHIFAGAYPNDDLTQEAVRSAQRRIGNVHLALCPHDGPTSKADCLNWIFQHVLLYEEQHGCHFKIIVIHDAEDLIHPDELLWINYYAARYDFVQTPVLALATPLHTLTHGIYCDEFAEYHIRDMPVRPLLGGFIPSAGVGTGYRRDALEKLAEAASNRVFEPEALTEDYENGLRLFRLGCSQAFVPLCGGKTRDFVATREFFPATWSAAVRQRTRWVMGVSLQAWQRYGWGATPGETYWLWRDRKGLVAAPLGLAANLVFVYGVATALWTRFTPFVSHAVAMSMPLVVLRVAVRMACTGRVYGWLFALGVPVRAVYANLLNAAATFQAIGRYTRARALGRSLQWVKTDHAFPSRATLLAHKRRLGEILVSSGFLTASRLNAVLNTKSEGVRLGEQVIRLGLVDEAGVYEALSLQQGLPLSDVDPWTVPRAVAHVIPEHAVHQWRVLPFQVAEGNLFLASPELPSTEMSAALRSFTALELRFHLVTPTKFERMKEALL